MHIESYSVNNQTYIRQTESIVVARGDGETTSKKKILLILGNLKKYDVGEADYIKRLRESFSKGNPLIPQLLPFVEGNRRSLYSPEDYLGPKNLGFLVLEALFDILQGTSVLTRHKSVRRLIMTCLVCPS